MNVFDVRKITGEQPIRQMMMKCIWEPFLKYFYKSLGWSAMIAEDPREQYNLFVGEFGCNGDFLYNRKEVIITPDNKGFLEVPKADFYYNSIKDMYYFTMIDTKSKTIRSLSWSLSCNSVATLIQENPHTYENGYMGFIDRDKFIKVCGGDQICKSYATVHNIQIFDDNITRAKKVICKMVMNLTQAYEDNWTDNPSLEKLEEAAKWIKDGMLRCVQTERETDEILNEYFLSPCIQEDFDKATHVY